MASEQDRVELTELSTQAETGGGRTMARPAGAIGGVPGSIAGTGMSGSETNDAMPGAAATGGTVMPDTTAPETSP